MKSETLTKMLDICQIYQKHLQPVRGNDKLRQKKLNIIGALMRCSTPQDIAFLLSDPKLGYQRVLKKRRTGYFGTSVELILILLTFPIAIPLLMLWSWIKRGDGNFFKTDGAIVVEKLLSLSAQNMSCLVPEATALTLPADANQSPEYDTQKKTPHFKHSPGFQLTSAISQHALKNLGLFSIENNSYISTDKIKTLYQRAALRTHPDKTQKDSNAEFIRIQSARAMLLDEEYNPDESTEQRSSRRTHILVNTVLPSVQEEQKNNQKDVKELEDKLKKIQMDLAQIESVSLEDVQAPLAASHSN